MKKWITYILTAFVLTGCSDEMPVNPAPPGTDEEGTVALTIRFPDSGPGTYAIGLAEENKISRLDVLSFIKNGSGSLLTDTLAYHLFVSGASITSEGTGQNKSVKVKLKNMVAGQRLVLIANLPAAVDFSTLTGATMETVINRLRFGGSTWRPPVAKADTTSFPMFGQMTGYQVIHSQTPLPPDLTFDMYRAVAKIDVGVDLHGTGDPALGYGSIFKIDSVYVYNSSDSGYIAPHNDFLLSPSLQNEKVHIVGSATVTEKRVARIAYKFPDTERRLGNIMYIPESDTLKGGITGYRPAYLVIKARYYDEPSYYRIDFANEGKYVPIIRNHSYVINITGIRTKGYATLEEARLAPESRLNASLVLDQADDTGLKEVITYNNEYYLAVNTKDLSADWMTQQVKLYVKTSFTGGWSASEQSGFTDFERKQNSNGRETVLDSVIFTVPNNLSGQPSVYTFNIKAGMLTFPVTVTQSPGSNSYITKMGTAVKIPITSANVDGTNRTAGATAFQVFWQKSSSLISSVTRSDNILTVTPMSGSSGNAVIVMKNSSGKILYSWHIWVTGYDPNEPATQKSNNGFIFMDRNLGAETSGTSADAYGLYYQWGRKDPFCKDPYYKNGQSTSFVVDTIGSDMSLEWAIQHPDTFCAVPLASTTYDWIGENRNNNMWNTGDDKKGPYDPCPFGWRVPVVKDNGAGSPWNGMSRNTGNGATYPLAGYLDAFSGIRYDAGTSGGVWGASASAQNAFVFTCTTGVAKTEAAFRANAYPVRCVKDVR